MTSSKCHTFILQTADALTLPVEQTEFSITARVVKVEDQVTLYFPAINFQIGQVAAVNPDYSPPVQGMVVTTAGYLPETLRPQDFMLPSIVAPAGDGFVPVATFEVNGPVPPTGYLVFIDSSGGLSIQQAGAVNNFISPGAHTIMPFSISYIVEKRISICKTNLVLDERFTDLTQFIGTSPYGCPAGDNIRDSHINDAFDDVFAWAYSGNPDEDSLKNTLNLFVIMGSRDCNGKIHIYKPVQLTNLPPFTLVWDTSIAINRTDKNNLCVSYGIIYYDSSGNSLSSVNCRAVSFDSGKTWGGVFDGTNSLPHNGLLPFQGPNGGFGDIPGVLADRFGAFWYCTTTNGLTYNQPVLLVSSDKGVTFDTIFTQPIPIIEFLGNISDNGSATIINISDTSNLIAGMVVTSDSLGYIPTGTTIDTVIDTNTITLSQETTYLGSGPSPIDTINVTILNHFDYPHITFGGGLNGTSYGIWMFTDTIMNPDSDDCPLITFIPITARGVYGQAQFTYLNSLPNSVSLASLAASEDGRFWAVGVSWYTSLYSLTPSAVLFKSAGPIDSNYAGPWLSGANSVIAQLAGSGVSQYGFKAVPQYGYFPDQMNVNGTVYDEKLKALYLLYSMVSPTYSQNCRIVFAISRNNGQSWSRIYDVGTTNFASRGFTSLVRDEKTGNLVIGWYDGRNDETLTRLQYFGEIIEKDILENLVNEIPLTNPKYIIPSQGSCNPLL